MLSGGTSSKRFLKLFMLKCLFLDSIKINTIKYNMFDSQTIITGYKWVRMFLFQKGGGVK